LIRGRLRPSRFPNLNPWYFYLWGNLKHKGVFI
jgi:hypothetical protein